MSQRKRILVCPLDWGLGHASRCIPIIRALQEKSAIVLIAADGAVYNLLQLEFPEIEFIRLSGFRIRYSDHIIMPLQMLFSLFSFLKSIREEKIALEKIVAENKIDVVISDNRYGCYSRNTYNIFITHQLAVKAFMFEKIIRNKIYEYIKQFDECWLPDDAAEKNLSGELSHLYPLPANYYFIGCLSRFKRNENHTVKKEFDLMGIVSGPEPQRKIFENLLLKEFKKTNLKCLLVCGEPLVHSSSREEQNITIINHLGTEEMKAAILSSEMIICRSGYTSIMDLAALCKKAILIPTPGQTEQEYLAKKIKNEEIAYSTSQSAFNLKVALDESRAYNGFTEKPHNNSFEERINFMLSSN